MTTQENDKILKEGQYNTVDKQYFAGMDSIQGEYVEYRGYCRLWS